VIDVKEEVSAARNLTQPSAVSAYTGAAAGFRLWPVWPSMGSTAEMCGLLGDGTHFEDRRLPEACAFLVARFY
jgi:hypothetical protein